MTVKLMHGDCREVLRTLPDQSVHCCVTSPPYWGLRSYLPTGHADKHLEIGSELTVDAWVQTMVDVFREVRRVLRDDGTCWINLGDSYANDGKWGGTTGGKQAYLGEENSKRVGREKRITGLKPKDLIGQPWRVAFALQADGWWWRDTIVWAKKNPMPSSVTDRCTPSWEPVLMLSKSAHYYFDAEAIKEPAKVWAGRAATFDRSGNEVAEHVIPGQSADQHRPRYKTPDGWDTSKGEGGHGSFHKAGREKGTVLPPKAAHSQSENDGAYADGKSERMGRGPGWRKRVDPAAPPMANKRNVWHIASAPFGEAHFATYPPELIRPAVLAGCPPGGTVLDPFGGSGTTGLVADQEGRNAILIDLDQRNLPMAFDRITRDGPLFAEVIA